MDLSLTLQCFCFIVAFIMTTMFALPEMAPPGNTFPTKETSIGGSGSNKGNKLVNLRVDTRQIVVAVAEAGQVPRVIPPPPARLVEPRPSTPVRDSNSPQPDNRASTSVEVRATPPSHANSSTLVGQNNDGSEQQSPAMQSMFPRFDPQVPLAQQQYYPTLERAPPALVRGIEGAQYSPSLYSQPRSPPAFGVNNPWAASRTQNAVTVSSPLRISELPSTVEVSSSEQLLDLWSIANGQTCAEAAEAYTLGLQWYGIITSPANLAKHSTVTLWHLTTRL